MIVNSLWAVLYYKEIKGKRNYIVLSIAMGLNVVSVACTALSNIDYGSD